jgi:aldehyde:ferredoxin oxidoreductase
VVTQKELNLLLDDYYVSRGWTLEGVPTAAKLKELGMEGLTSVIKGKQEA